MPLYECVRVYVWCTGYQDKQRERVSERGRTMGLI